MPPGNDGNNIYYEYYATQVMHHMGGDAWDFWNMGPDGTGKGGIRDALISQAGQAPRPETAAAGRIDPTRTAAGMPNGPWGRDGGGRIMYTSLSLLTLEVYYRHLPLYRREMNVNKEADMANEKPK